MHFLFCIFAFGAIVLRQIMKFIKLLTIIILHSAYLLSSNLYGQDAWSLERCIEHAHRNNLQIKQQMLSIEQAKNNLLQSKLDFIPSLNAGINHNMNWGKSVNINDLQITNQLTQSTSSSISAAVPIIEGLAKVNTLKGNKVMLELSIQNFEKLKNEITISITQAFLQILLSVEVEKFMEQSCRSMEEQVARTKKLVEAGSQAYSTLLEMEAQLANERVQLVEAGNNVRSNYLVLVQLLDLPDNSGFTVEYPDTCLPVHDLSGYDIDRIYGSAQSLPQIKSAELQLEKSRYDYKIQKGNAYPSLSFSAGYGTYYSDSREQAFFQQFNENRNPSIGFSLNIPIFNGWRTNTAIRNARLNVEQNELELKRSRQQLYKEIATACNYAAGAYEKYIAAEKNMQASMGSFNYVEQKFNAGIVNGTDYIVAKTNLSKSQSESLQSKFQYIFQLKILDFYRGIPIKL